MTQEPSSPEFVGVRRGSSGPNLLRENVVDKVEKMVKKKDFTFCVLFFPCVLGAITSKHT